jgi:hypothetical protein
MFKKISFEYNTKVIIKTWISKLVHCQKIGKAKWFKSLWEQVNTKGPNYKQDSENGLRLHMSGERLI